MWGRTVGVWTPYPPGSSPYPRPIFSSLPRPPFFLFFFRVPPPQNKIFCLRPLTHTPLTIFRQKPPPQKLPCSTTLHGGAPFVYSWRCNASSHQFSATRLWFRGKYRETRSWKWHSIEDTGRWIASYLTGKHRCYIKVSKLLAVCWKLRLQFCNMRYEKWAIMGTTVMSVCGPLRKTPSGMRMSHGIRHPGNFFIVP